MDTIAAVEHGIAILGGTNFSFFRGFCESFKSGIISFGFNNHERNPPIEEVIQSGVVPRFVEFLARDDYPQLHAYFILFVLLNYSHLIAIGVGSTIGAGVYILVGAVAREHSGPSYILVSDS